MATIAELQARFYQRTIDIYWQSLGASRTTTTLDLYRRTTQGFTDDLGVPNDPYTLQVSGQPCTIVGIKYTREGAFNILPEGQIQHPILEVHCSLTDVQAGDNVVLALTGLAYLVDRATIEGPITYLL